MSILGGMSHGWLFVLALAYKSLNIIEPCTSMGETAIEWLALQISQISPRMGSRSNCHFQMQPILLL